MTTMKEALKAHYSGGKDMTTRQVFDAMDIDGSGALDISEVEKASGVLGVSLGFVMGETELARQVGCSAPLHTPLTQSVPAGGLTRRNGVLATVLADGPGRRWRGDVCRVRAVVEGGGGGPARGRHCGLGLAG